MRLVLIRHGESVWNKENIFTGWTDVDLSEAGVAEAHEAGRLLREGGHSFVAAFTSVLLRAERTLQIVLDELGQRPPIERSWRLNERHYGALQGLRKDEMAGKFGDEQVRLWRRSYDVRPPALSKEDARWPGHDPKYAAIPPAELPLTECLKDCIARVMPYWHAEIEHRLREGDVLIVAHGNSLRGIVKHLDAIPDADIVGLNIPTGIPLVYELDGSLKPVKKSYLGDQAEVAARTATALKRP